MSGGLRKSLQDRRQAHGFWRATAYALLWIATGSIASLAAAQSGGSFVLRKQVIAPGGRADSSGLSLATTLAEPGSGVHAGGSFHLTGGFQTPRIALGDALLADGFE